MECIKVNRGKSDIDFNWFHPTRRPRKMEHMTKANMQFTKLEHLGEYAISDAELKGVRELQSLIADSGHVSALVEASLSEFIEEIQKVKTLPKDFLTLPIGGPVDLLPNYIPCLRTKLAIGVFEGERNRTAFQLGVFLQRLSLVIGKQNLKSTM